MTRPKFDWQIVIATLCLLLAFCNQPPCCAQSRNASASELMQAGETAFHNSDWIRAEELLRQSIELDPHNREALDWYSKALLNHAWLIARTDTMQAWEKAHLSEYINHTPQASQLIDKLATAFAWDPKSFADSITQAEKATRDGNTINVIVDYERAVAIQPEPAIVRLLQSIQAPAGAPERLSLPPHIVALRNTEKTAVVALGSKVVAAGAANTTATKSATGHAPATAKPTIRDDKAYKQFIGADGGAFHGGDPQFAADIVDTVLNYPNINFDLPNLPNGQKRCCVPISGASLVAYEPFQEVMIAALPPDDQNKNPYATITKPYESGLRAKILASNGNLSPAQVLRMCLDLTGGNYPTATLLAHNFLKNIAYNGRYAIAKLARLIEMGRPFTFPADIGAVAAKLTNLRAAPGDKMGIWYHSFVPLTIAAWTGNESSADQSIHEEYLARSIDNNLGWLLNKFGLGIGMGSPLDEEKRTSDRRFAEASHQIFQKRGARPTILVCEASVTPKQGSVNTEFKMKLIYQIINLGSAGKPIITESLSVSGPDFSNELREKNSEVDLAEGRQVALELPYQPTVEGQHHFQYKLMGSNRFINAQGSVPFTVRDQAGSFTGVWRNDNGLSKLEITEQNGSYKGTHVWVSPDHGYDLRIGSTSFLNGRLQDNRTMLTNNFCIFKQKGDCPHLGPKSDCRARLELDSSGNHMKIHIQVYSYDCERGWTESNGEQVSSYSR